VGILPPHGDRPVFDESRCSAAGIPATATSTAGDVKKARGKLLRTGTAVKL
jgi:hypothetical protein